MWSKTKDENSRSEYTEYKKKYINHVKKTKKELYHNKKTHSQTPVTHKCSEKHTECLHNLQLNQYQSQQRNERIS